MTSENPDAQPPQQNTYQDGYSYQYSAGAYEQGQPHVDSLPNHNTPSIDNAPTNPFVTWEDKTSKYRFIYAITTLILAILLSVVVSFTRTPEYYYTGLKHFHQYIVFLISLAWPLAVIYMVIYLLIAAKVFLGVSSPTPPQPIVQMIYLVQTVLVPIFTFVFAVVALNTTRTYAVSNFSYLMVWGLLTFQTMCLMCFLLIKSSPFFSHTASHSAV